MMTLAPAAQALRDLMSAISQDVYAASWMDGCEWTLWRSLTDWRNGNPARWAYADISDRMDALDGLQRDAGGWVWWLDPDGTRFVSEPRWLRLVAERAREQGHISNEQLNIRIREDRP